MKLPKGARLATRCVHAGIPDDEVHGAVNPAIQLSTTFRQPEPAKPLTFDYSRAGNPTREALENAIAELEQGATGHAFGSGLSALDAIARTLEKDDHIVCAEDAYGGSIRLLERVIGRAGIATSFVDTRDEDAIAEAMRPETKMVLMETPTNPLLRVTDIRAVADLAHDKDAQLVVDNTFMSPVLQNPLALGADIVFHSATKYIGGHSDVLAGLAVCKDPEMGERLRFLQLAVGAVLSPFDAYLLLRGLKTLHLRVERQQATAAGIAARLDAHKRVERVHYPGLIDDPGHAIHAAQASGPGSMLSFVLADGKAAKRCAKRTHIWQLAESLGAVESLIQIPAIMTHASVPPEMRKRTGLVDGLVRLSVGVEDGDDLWQDLERAIG